ncbi:flagellar motor protein MotB [Rubellimicrobium thermophilum]|uniref:flagellar motor protein MotB n=1 Tax=Rubellimicrobium thermophilum TaxID=295419 RepID=UPI00041AC8A5
MAEQKKGQTPATLIVKRRRGGGEGAHHGGAWKVAYADFVTAMMAFFLLMWLLNATTEQQKKGLADYFAPDVPISRVSAGGMGCSGAIRPLRGMCWPRTGAAPRRAFWAMPAFPRRTGRSIPQPPPRRPP